MAFKAFRAWLGNSTARWIAIGESRPFVNAARTGVNVMA